MLSDHLVVVRGAGDLATGVIQTLMRAGFQVCAFEHPMPSAVRRTVSLCEAVFEGTATVEGIEARLCKSAKEAKDTAAAGLVAILVDPDMKSLDVLKPLAFIEATLSKVNRGVTKQLAPITICLGPGFDAGVDCDAVIETVRGHHLGRLIFSGRALPNTGIPGPIGGIAAERVLRAPADGVFETFRVIGDIVEAGDPVAKVNDSVMTANISGIVRGLLRSGHLVKKGQKSGDIDPRHDVAEHCSTISDKARNLGGAVLSAILLIAREKRIDL